METLETSQCFVSGQRFVAGLYRMTLVHGPGPRLRNAATCLNSGLPVNPAAEPRGNLNSTIVLASDGYRAYIAIVALQFESGPFFVSLQASNPVPYPIAAVRPVTRCCVTERR